MAIMHAYVVHACTPTRNLAHVNLRQAVPFVSCWLRLCTRLGGSNPCLPRLQLNVFLLQCVVTTCNVKHLLNYHAHFLTTITTSTVCLSYVRIYRKVIFQFHCRAPQCEATNFAYVCRSRLGILCVCLMTWEIQMVRTGIKEEGVLLLCAETKNADRQKTTYRHTKYLRDGAMKP